MEVTLVEKLLQRVLAHYELRYSDEQPRDEHGRWASGGDADNPPVRDIPFGKTTEDVWKNPETGKYAPEREAWHQAFADREIAGVKSQEGPGRPPVAIVMGGGTASGKSTMARAITGDKDSDFVHVDADSIKPQLPEHDQLREQEDPEPANTVSRNPNLAASREHEESSDMAKLVLAKAAANRLDIVYDATSSGKGLAVMANKLASEGYDVHMNFVDVPEGVAIERAAARAANPADPAGFGRQIPAEAMHNTHVLSAANFMLMKDSSQLASARLYDTRGEKPNLVYSRVGNGKEEIHDPATWAYYGRKAAGQ